MKNRINRRPGHVRTSTSGRGGFRRQLARRSFGAGHLAEGRHWRVNVDGSMSSPRRSWVSAAGPLLRELHRDPTHLERLALATGRSFEPTRASYIHYRPGDHVGLHIDAADCGLTLVTRLGGSLDPLVVHPQLAGLPPAQLVEISRASRGMPRYGLPVRIPAAGAFLMMWGSTMPHHRPAALDHGVIATLCYR